MTVITRPIEGFSPERNSGAAYRTVWRWHFYAGLFCLPFIAVLAVSGSIYLFKPQIDAYLDRGFDHLPLSRAPRPLDAQAEAARETVPGARLIALEFRRDKADAARVQLMTADGRQFRVLVRPDTLEILRAENENSRFTQIVHDLHGELLLGAPGAIAVELAGAWAIVMVITGLYMWWPRGRGLAGILYPRLSGGRVLLRDLHAVTGFWLSAFALFYLISALPWTTVWGQGFKYLRQTGQRHEVKQDWTTGPASEQALRLEAFRKAPPARGEQALDEHGEHAEHAGHAGHMHEGASPSKSSGFDKIAALVAPLKLAEPVLIKPPSLNSPRWIVQSLTQNRPLRETLAFDPNSLAMVRHETFADRPMLDRIFGVGVAAHEGQLFGWFNQSLGLMTAAGYLTLAVTAALKWWRRRPEGVLGAPPQPAHAPKLAPLIIGLIAALGIVLPMFGMSLAAVLLAEFAIRHFAPGPGRWLGLLPAVKRSPA